MRAIEILPCTDAAYVDGLIEELRDQIAPDGYDDAAPSVTSACWLDRADVLCIEVRVDGSRSGAFLFLPENGGMTVHTLLVPPARGAVAIEAGKTALRWVWNNTTWPRLHSYCYEPHKHTLLFAKRCGFQVAGTISDNTTIDHKPVRTLLLVIDRPEEGA